MAIDTFDCLHNVSSNRPFVVAVKLLDLLAMTHSLKIEQVAWDHPDACDLRQQQRIDIAALYERVDSEPGTPPTADDITCFCVAYQDGEPVGCGGLRRLDQDSAELKRMFVTKQARGKGAALAVLDFLERKSLALGMHRLLLETGDKLMEAHRFYTRNGYKVIPNFGYYQDVDSSICMEKILVPRSKQDGHT